MSAITVFYDRILGTTREKDGVQIVSSDPSSALEGTIIVNAITNDMKIYYAGVWQVLHTLTDSRDYLLLETGDFLLTETGFKILL